MKNIKKYIKILLILLLFNLFFCNGSNFCVYADNSSLDESSNLEEELQDNVNEQLGNLGLDSFDKEIAELTEQGTNIFGSSSFWQKVSNLIQGDFGSDYSTYFQAIINTFFSEILDFIPLLATIVAITVICSLVGSLKGKESSESIGQIVNFVAFAVVVVIVSSTIIGLFTMSQNLINSISSQMQLLFPILLTLLASVGGVVSVGIFQPAVGILSSVIVQVFSVLVMPMLIVIFIFSIVNSISSNIKLDKIISFFQSILKWLSGICFSVFLFVLMIQGIVAGSFDSVSIKAMKFALKSYVPILGGYLSDGFNVAMASSVLIKNAVGMVGLILLFASVIVPVLKIAVCILFLKLSAGILQPITESKVPDFLVSVSKLLNLLVMILLGIAFMYFVTVGLILCTSNSL